MSDVEPKPKKPTNLRNFRLDAPLWEEALAVAQSRGESLSEVIRAALVAYVKKHGKDLQ